MHNLFNGSVNKSFVRASTPDPMSLAEAYFHAGGIVVFAMLYTFTHHPYFFGVMHLGMKARVALCALIYRKVSKKTKNHAPPPSAFLPRKSLPSYLPLGYITPGHSEVGGGVIAEEEERVLAPSPLPPPLGGTEVSTIETVIFKLRSLCFKVNLKY